MRQHKEKVMKITQGQRISGIGIAMEKLNKRKIKERAREINQKGAYATLQYPLIIYSQVLVS